MARQMHDLKLADMRGACSHIWRQVIFVREQGRQFSTGFFTWPRLKLFVQVSGPVTATRMPSKGSSTAFLLALLAPAAGRSSGTTAGRGLPDLQQHTTDASAAASRRCQKETAVHRKSDVLQHSSSDQYVVSHIAALLHRFGRQCIARCWRTRRLPPL